MQNYINQLVEDLEEAAKNPPAPSYFETPPHLEGMEDVSELAQTPYKTIEELTGIKQEEFPEIIALSGDQWGQVNKAIFKVFDSLKLLLVDKPEDIPPEILYEVLTTNWKTYVQYLPSSGMDLELCTGDPWDCPYGEYCTCGEVWEEDYEIPDEYESAVAPITQYMFLGKECHLNCETMEVIEEFPASEHNKEGYIPGPSQGPTYISFFPPDHEQIVEMMIDFAENTEDELLGDELIDILSGVDPIDMFNQKLIRSDYDKQWVDHQMSWIEKNVRYSIREELERLVKWPEGEYNGFYNDDGTKVDPETVPVPNLCVICKRHLDEDWEENLLCLMNRNDQRNSDDFQCGAFEKID